MYPMFNKYCSISLKNCVTLIVQSVSMDGDLVDFAHSGFGVPFDSLVKSIVSTLWSLGRLACWARHAALRNCCFALSAMKWPVSIAVIISFLFQGSDAFMQCFLCQIIHKINYHWSEQMLSNRSVITIDYLKRRDA